MDGKDYLLTVTMLTYNNEKDVRQAIDSILMQEVNFDYDMIISDDASTDKTQDIIKEYMGKYPGKIKAVLREENVGATKNSYGVKMMVESKYIAVLDADDYWIDKNKLQKQINYLEKNPDVIGCACKFMKVSEDGQPLKTRYASNRHYDKRFTMDDFLNGKTFRLFQSSSVVYRNIYYNSDRDFTIFYRAHSMIGDVTTMAILLDLGDFYLFSEQMSVYRVKRKSNADNCGSIVRRNPLEATRLALQYADTLEEYFNNKYNMKFMRDVAVNFSLFNYKSLTTEEKREFKKIVNKLELSYRLRYILRYMKRNTRYYILYLPKKS